LLKKESEARWQFCWIRKRFKICEEFGSFQKFAGIDLRVSRPTRHL
jgi:hypothetical protein